MRPTTAPFRMLSRGGIRFGAPGLRSVLLLTLAVLLAAPAAAAPPHRYYVSLGDSLALGMQPDTQGHDRATGTGYVDILGRRIAAAVPELSLAKVGCAGETTASMLAHSHCRYAAGSQIAAAETFLRRHSGSVALVTVGIGDNDVERCFGAGRTVDAGCVMSGFAAIRANLPGIVARLRAAAGPRVPIAGVADYDQFLAYWLRGTAGRRAARASVRIVGVLNETIDDIYASAGVMVADAASRFATGDMARLTPLPGHHRVPVAVARICRLTWACSAPPIGFDDHANRTGYAEIANAIEASLNPVVPRLFVSGHRHITVTPGSSRVSTGGPRAGK